MRFALESVLCGICVVCLACHPTSSSPLPQPVAPASDPPSSTPLSATPPSSGDTPPQSNPPATGAEFKLHLYELNGVERTPVPAEWVAGRDGDGAWQVLAPNGADYSLSVSNPDGRYSVVVVCHLNFIGERSVFVMDATLAEIPELHRQCDPQPDLAPSYVNLSFVWSNAGDGATQELTQLNQAVVTSFSPAIDLHQGSYDIFSRSAGPAGTFQRGSIMRNVELSPSAPLVSVDFNDGFDFAAAPVTVTDEAGGSELVEVDFRFRTSTHKGAPLGGAIVAAGASPVAIPQVPAAELGEGELNVVSANHSSGTMFAYSERLQKDPGPTSVNMPALPTSVTVSTTPAASFLSFSYQWSGIPRTALILAQVVQEESHRWLYVVTPNVRNGATVATVPDFSGLAGWDPNWSLLKGEPAGALLTGVRTNHSWQEALDQTELETPNTFSVTDGLQVDFAGYSDVIFP